MLLCGAGCCLWTRGLFGRRRGWVCGRAAQRADVWFGASPDVQLGLSISNFARNSSTAHSNIEFASLELQRFCGVSKNDRDKLCAKFGWRWCRRRPLRPGPAAHGHRSRPLRSPLHRRGLSLCVARSDPAGLAAAFNRSGCLCVAWPGPAAAHGHCGQAMPRALAVAPKGLPERKIAPA